jgi:uncharacterized protein
MDTNILIIVFASFFAAALIKGLTGLGFMSICLPLVSSFIDITVAIPLLIIPSLASNVMLIAQTKRFGESVRRFWPLYVSAFPGLYVGVSLLYHTGNTIAKAVLGLMSIAYSLYLLLNINISVGNKYERFLNVPVGLANGFLNGLTGTQVMPMLPYLISLRLHRDLLINAINLGFTLSTLVLLALLGKFDFLTLHIIGISVIGIIPVSLGIFIGSKLRYHISDERFRIAVLIILLIVGLNLILNR